MSGRSADRTPPNVRTHAIPGEQDKRDLSHSIVGVSRLEPRDRGRDGVRSGKWLDGARGFLLRASHLGTRSRKRTTPLAKYFYFRDRWHRDRAAAASANPSLI